MVSVYLNKEEVEVILDAVKLYIKLFEKSGIDAKVPVAYRVMSKLMRS